jgi:hypothetical protein
MNTNFDDVEAFINTTPGVVQNSIVDVKGDLIVATAADAVARLAAGTNTYVLTADSTEATGLIWAAPTTGDITGVTAGTNISGGGTSGTVTVNLAIDAAVAMGSDGSGVDVTFHSDTAGDYALWDSSEEKLILEGTNSATVLDVTDGDVVIADGTLDVSGVITATSGVSGNVTGTAATVTGAAQTNITSVGTLTGLTLSGAVVAADQVVGEPQLKDYSETVEAAGSKSAAFDLDFEDGNVATVTFTSGTFNVGIVNALASHSNSMTILLTNGGTATPSFLAGANGSGGNAVKWAGGTAPDLTSSGTDVLCFTTFDGGTNYYGFAAGLDFSAP